MLYLALVPPPSVLPTLESLDRPWLLSAKGAKRITGLRSSFPAPQPLAPKAASGITRLAHEETPVCPDVAMAGSQSLSSPVIFLIDLCSALLRSAPLCSAPIDWETICYCGTGELDIIILTPSAGLLATCQPKALGRLHHDNSQRGWLVAMSSFIACILPYSASF